MYLLSNQFPINFASRLRSNNICFLPASDCIAIYLHNFMANNSGSGSGSRVAASLATQLVAKLSGQNESKTQIHRPNRTRVGKRVQYKELHLPHNKWLDKLSQSGSKKCWVRQLLVLWAREQTSRLLCRVILHIFFFIFLFYIRLFIFALCQLQRSRHNKFCDRLLVWPAQVFLLLLKKQLYPAFR